MTDTARLRDAWRTASDALNAVMGTLMETNELTETVETARALRIAAVRMNELADAITDELGGRA